jgi:hypothetical protein
MMKEEKQGSYTSPEEAAHLGTNHRRVLASAYRQLERAVWQLETQLTQEQSPHLTLTRMIEEFDSTQQSALFQVLKQIREEVVMVAARYHFDVQRESRRRSVAAEFAILWSHLEEMRPRHLQVYGSLPAHLEEELTPVIQRAIDLVQAVQAIAQGDPEVIQLWQVASHLQDIQRAEGEIRATDESK